MRMKKGKKLIVMFMAALMISGVMPMSGAADKVSAADKPPRAEWNEDRFFPQFGELKQENEKIIVPYEVLIGYDGADKIDIIMTPLFEQNNILETQSSSEESTSGSFAFEPKASGNYAFLIKAFREGEQEVITSIRRAFMGFVLPPAAPSFQSATSRGGGSVDLVWNEVPDADSYHLFYSTDGSNYSGPIMVTGTSYTVSGLTAGTTYTFKLKAVRNNPALESREALIEALITEKDQMERPGTEVPPSHDVTPSSPAGTEEDTLKAVSNKNGQVVAPKTGDNANVWMYVLLLAAALCSAGGCAFVSYKKKLGETKGNNSCNP